jgi:membrane-bound inhibitor of C-type lysozyme
MKHLSSLACVGIIGFSLLLAGCGSISIWPFGESQTASISRGPVNATEYRCAGGKTFYVRYLDAGKSAWVILPDRQVRLDKATATGDGRYTNGIAVLTVTTEGAELTDGPASYTACKTAGANK